MWWISEDWVLQYPFFQEIFVMQSMAMQNLLSFFAICLVPHSFMLQDKEGRSLHGKAS
jgi:hypothetical protein